ncbi:hypothetical protein [Gemmobacter denitrificans]|uniref:Secreted protein n=1 Tax=Gemmobacter denitrificans TaxID=3123040 RepID=A0ABU8C0G1_9RHOB
MTIKSALGALAMMFTAWLALIALVTVATDDAPAFVVLFPSRTLQRNLGAESSVLSVSAFSLTVASNETHAAMNLYRKGAWLVLPARLRGCVPNP